MKFLLHSKKRPKKHWLDYFDIVITGSQKPNFFKSKNSLYEVDLDTGLLKNIEVLPVVSSPASIFQETKLEVESSPHCCKKTAFVFQGGHVKLLHDMLNIQRGSEILYVGDHIYGDILRSKKEIGWRTMLVIEELEAEVHKLSLLKEQYLLCNSLNQKRERLVDELERIQIALTTKKIGRGVMPEQLKHVSIEECESQIKKISILIAKILQAEEKALLEYHKAFHPIWGELMKTARQNSRFSAQVINYSCLYTSKLANLRHYGANKNFSAVRDYMPHDLDF